MKRYRVGFTLIELLISTSIFFLIMPALGMVFYQFLTVPAEESNVLTAAHEVRVVARWLNSDVNNAEAFSPGEDPVYGTFRWKDRVSGADYAVRYYYEDHMLVREKSINGSVNASASIAHHIASWGNVSFTPRITHLNLSVTSTIGNTSTTESTSKTLTICIVPMVESGWPWGPDAISAVNTSGGTNLITFFGSNSVVDGDIHSNGDIVVSGSGNEVVGEVEAQSLTGTLDYGSLKVPGELWQAPYIGEPQDYFINDLSTFTINDSAHEYIFTGDVNLSARDDVWQETSEPYLTLKPGTYYSPGTITLTSDYITGKVTFIANKIEIEGCGIELSPYEGDLLLWGTGDGDNVIYIWDAGSRWTSCGTFQGSLYAPEGEIELGIGLSPTILRSAIVGEQVMISGDGWTISRR